MSIGPLGVPGAAAHDANVQARETDSAKQAARAAGIGETEQDHEATDRDADGRRLWETAAGDSSEADSPAEENPTLETPSRDATGTRGNRLDLSG